MSRRQAAARSVRALRRTIIAAAVASIGLAPAHAAVVDWTDASGFWDVSANWSSNPALPGATDDVNINVGGTHTVTVRNPNNFTINSLSILGDETLAITGGSLTISNGYTSNGTTNLSGGSLVLNAPSTLATFIQSGGSLSGTGNVTVTGATTLRGGVMVGAGSTIVQGPLTIELFGIGLDTGRTLDVQGGASWTAGTIALNPNSTGVATAGHIINRSGSVFNNTFNGSISASNFGAPDNGDDALFTNEAGATFRKSGGTGTTTISSRFNNSGTLEVQTGTVSLNNGGTHSGSFTGTGTVQFGGGTHDLTAASSVTAANATMSSGIVNINGSYNVSGTTTVSGATANFNGTLTSLGNSFILSFGTANLGGASATVTTLTQSGGTLSGTSNLTVSGAATLSGGQMLGAGSTITQGPLTINVSGIALDTGRTLDVQGGATWSAGSINLNPTSTGVAAAGRIVNRSGSVFDNTFNGSMFTQNFGGVDDGASALFDNQAGATFRKSGGTGTTTISSRFNNSGTVEVQTGTLSMSQGGAHSGSFNVSAGAVLNFSGGTHNLNNAGAVSSVGTIQLSNGTVNTTGTFTNGGLLQVTGGTLNSGGPITTVNYTQTSGTLSGTSNLTVSGGATLRGGEMVGAGSTITQGPLTINVSGIALDTGRTLDVQGGASWTAGTIALNPNSTGTATAGHIINRSGSVFNNTFNGSISASNFGAPDNGDDALFTNEAGATFRKSAGTGTTSIGSRFNNSGTVQAQTGTLSFNRGVQGTSGTLQTASGAQLTLGATSTTGTLINGGTTNLGTNAITIHSDYDNANFGVGNAFNRRANITGTGTLIAAANANQGIGGTGVSGGTTNTPTLTLGNVHVGTNTYTYDIQNTGTTGPSLRGAIQTSVNGGNITDARLSGSGVTAGNWGPIATGGGTLSREVVFNVASAGTYTPLSGQAVRILNNFENTRSQLLAINSAPNAAAYRYASPVVDTTSVDLVARVGGMASAGVGVSNTAPNDGFSEGLNASPGAGPAGFTTSGSIVNLPAGNSNSSSLQVALDTATSGTFGGTVAVNFVSNGTISGLPDTPLPSGSVAVSGRVYAPAVAQRNTASVNFGIVHVADTIGARNISISNVASGALTDTLKASMSTVSAPFTGAGSFSGLAAGGTDNTSLSVNLNTASAGVFSGTAAIDITSQNGELADLPLGTLSVNLNAQVNNFANGTFEKQSEAGTFSQAGSTWTLDFGTLMQGSSAVHANLAVLNDVMAPADLLDGTFTMPGMSDFTFSGFSAFADLDPGELFEGLMVSFDPDALGSLTSTVQLSLLGHNASGFSGSLGDIYLTVHADVTVIPEPGTYAMILAGLGLLGFAARRRRIALRC